MIFINPAFDCIVLLVSATGSNTQQRQVTWIGIWWYRTWRWREVRDSSQSFSWDIVRMEWRYNRTGL